MGVFGAVVGGVIGGVAGGISSYALAKNNAQAYKKAAKQIRAAAQKYSGRNAYNAMQSAGNTEGNIYNQRALGAQLNRAPQNNSAEMANVANLRGGFEQGYNLGSQNQNTLLKSNYNADTAQAQQALNQANIDYKAGTAATQAAMNTAGGLASLYGQLKSQGGQNTSDESQKSPINNDSGLPESDLEDSMRQIETVSYKYKDPSIPGCDGETHESGVIAQSLEKTPLYKDTVNEGEDGVKRIDNWKLLEAVTAATSQLQREIDELRVKKADGSVKGKRVK